MNAKELLAGILDESPWVDRERTVDRIIDGNADKELKKLLVVWRCTFETLEIAIREGYDGILAHEPTYYFHRNEADSLAAMRNGPKKETALKKQKMIRENDLVVIRVHDSWDSRDDNGVAAMWAKSFGLTNRVYKSEPPACECCYDTEPMTASVLYERVREATKNYQIPEAVLYGDPGTAVKRIGLGAGCIGDLEMFINMGCDIAIVCFDGMWYWEDITFALDRGFPVIQVSHAAAEEAGISALADWVRGMYGIETRYMQEKACR